MNKRIKELLEDLEINCPDCGGIDDEQYTCTTCWCQGGEGKIKVLLFLRENKEYLYENNHH